MESLQRAQQGPQGEGNERVPLGMRRPLYQQSTYTRHAMLLPANHHHSGQCTSSQELFVQYSFHLIMHSQENVHCQSCGDAFPPTELDTTAQHDAKPQSRSQSNPPSKNQTHAPNLPRTHRNTSGSRQTALPATRNHETRDLCVMLTHHRMPDPSPYSVRLTPKIFSKRAETQFTTSCHQLLLATSEAADEESSLEEMRSAVLAFLSLAPSPSREECWDGGDEGGAASRGDWDVCAGLEAAWSKGSSSLSLKLLELARLRRGLSLESSRM